MQLAKQLLDILNANSSGDSDAIVLALHKDGAGLISVEHYEGGKLDEFEFATLADLQNEIGRLSGKKIVPTVEEMIGATVSVDGVKMGIVTRVQYTPMPGQPGSAWQFYVENRNGSHYWLPDIRHKGEWQIELAS